MWISNSDWRDFQDLDSAPGMALSVLYQILHLLKTSIGQEQTMAKGLDDLRNAAAAQTSVVAGVSTLLQGLAQQLKDAVAGDDDSAVEDLANQIASNTASLAQAVTANTPAASSAPAAPAPSADSRSRREHAGRQYAANVPAG
jgi:hypothetical protein